MFDRSAAVYDAIYRFKNYTAEADRIRELIGERSPDARSLLDVACGTGKHLAELGHFFSVAGLDLDRQLLAIARRHNPGVPFHEGNMGDFHLRRRFDVVTCLFSSIGYMSSEPLLRRAVSCMAGHVTPGGLLLIEPWLTPDRWQEGLLGAVFVDDPDLKVARFNSSAVKDGCSVMDMHYLVTRPSGAPSTSPRLTA